MNDERSKEDRIREQAYFLWLEEGMPQGRDKEHWEQAERMIERMEELAKEDERGEMPAVGAALGPGEA